MTNVQGLNIRGKAVMQSRSILRSLFANERNISMTLVPFEVHWNDISRRGNGMAQIRYNAYANLPVGTRASP